MYLFNEAGQKLGHRRPLFNFFMLGAGPDAFIGPCAWLTNMFATYCFALKWAAPSRDETKAAAFAANFDLDDQHVSTDYQSLLATAVAEDGDDLVVVIATETPNHFQQLLDCIAAGVKWILIDKPVVDDYQQWAEVQAAAEEAGCTILVSYQHSMNAATAQMAALARDYIAANGPENVNVHAFFRQDWLYQPPMHIRQVWRLADEFCGLKDIWTHALQGARTVVGARPATILSSNHSKARIEQLNQPALDNGSCHIEFENGVRGTVSYHQAEPGHADDIGWSLKLGDTHYMWRMDWNPDALYVSTGDGNVDDNSQWQKHLRGHSKMFNDEIAGAWGKNPPGHTQGWDTLWLAFLFGCVHHILKTQGDARAETMVPFASNPVPTFDNDGEFTTAGVEAAIRSFREARAVTLEEVRS